MLIEAIGGPPCALRVRAAAKNPSGDVNAPQSLSRGATTAAMIKVDNPLKVMVPQGRQESAAGQGLLRGYN